jgi:hypothetical protein
VEGIWDVGDVGGCVEDVGGGCGWRMWVEDVGGGCGWRMWVEDVGGGCGAEKTETLYIFYTMQDFLFLLFIYFLLDGDLIITENVESFYYHYCRTAIIFIL